MWTAAVVGVTTVLMTALTAGDGRAAPPEPDPRIGAVFFGNTPLHTCSGGVLDTPAHDLVLTAAHCVVGPGAAISFSPGYHDGTSPLGKLDVTQVYLDPRWIDGNDPHADYAVLRVAEPILIAGLKLSTAPAVGTAVTVSGYTVGLGDRPLVCSSTTTLTQDDYPTTTCPGFGNGTSGSPWVTDAGDVVGLIGGLHEGGCPPDPANFSPPFDEHTAELVRRAVDNAPADTAPVAFEDGC